MDALVAVACGTSAVGGFCLALSGQGALAARRRQHRVKSAIGGSPADASGVRLGREPPVVLALVRASGTAPQPGMRRIGAWRVWALGMPDVPEMLARAGLADRVNPAGVRLARVEATAAGAGAGALLGLPFTPELSVVLAVAGAVGGFCSVPATLRGRAAARRAEMEGHLSQMVEVVVLGLHAGLSFEQSFLLYPRYFNSGLGESMERVVRRWDMGLASREEALRALEAEYDSPLLSRVVGSMVRSLRFGTSIAESLEAAAREAREVHRARMEERVAKVAVKMLLPVGTLILPAMLLLVMGPVLLELMDGF